jgi:hypothetical protein
MNNGRDEYAEELERLPKRKKDREHVNHMCTDCLRAKHRKCLGVVVKTLAVHDCDCVCWEIPAIHPDPRIAETILLVAKKKATPLQVQQLEMRLRHGGVPMSDLMNLPVGFLRKMAGRLSDQAAA